MPARGAVHELLESDVELQALGVEAVYGSNSIDSPEEQCFVVIRWEPSEGVFSDRGVDRCSVWAHDKERDYGRIDKILDRARAILNAAVHVAGADGYTLTQARWTGFGPDLVDGGFHTITRYADFTVVSR